MQKKAEQIVAGVIALLSVLVSVLDFLGVFDAVPWIASRIPTLTLLVVGSIAGYLVLAHKSKLDELELLVREGVERTIRSLDGVDVRRFQTYGELIEYVTVRIGQAQKRIDDLTWGTPAVLERTVTERRASVRYREKTIEACTEGGIEYREVVTLPDWQRLKRAEAIAKDGIPDYYLRYYEKCDDHTLPLVTFMVIDSEEVIIASYRQPYLPPEGEIRLAIRHPDIVHFFQDYYNTIWHGARVIKEANQVEWSVLQEMRQRLEAQERIAQ